ncbi:hypothetical protein [Facklamia miroungae]|uniref:Uncharacterized protein n=1 Tax=Facklamia miroungae TaxID=120956 RepID=A0A1G7QL87_9LACT|nr:hypothetical protein [Facklamia miroungae]NKZ28964.1 hypothetical protein [Facklamia miroungae]SDF98669.1 hypothetical protein SAMN05421791_102113 [Facklamia miroungae]
MKDIVSILLTIVLIAGSSYHFYKRSRNIFVEVIQSYWIWTQLITIGLLIWIGFQFASSIWHYLLIASAILYFLSGPLARGISKSDFSVFRGTLSVMIPISFAKVDRVVITRDLEKKCINLLGKANNQYFAQSFPLNDEVQLIAHLKQANIEVDIQDSLHS